MDLLQPTLKQERVAVVDGLRGMALLAIIIANIPFAYESLGFDPDRMVVLGSAGTDKALNFLFHLLIDKKFVAIFSLLFGFGCYLQLERAEAKQVAFRPYFIRRMLLLLLIGCVHAYLFWFGDIVRDYALCGLFLLLVYRWPAKKILQLGAFFTVFLTATVFIINGVVGIHYRYDPALFAKHPISPTYGRYLQINATIDPFVNFVQDSPLTLVFAFGTMLIGFGLAKAEYFHQPRQFNGLRKRLILLGCTAGLTCSFLFWRINTGALELSPPLLWLPFVIVAGMLLQSLCYVSAFVQLFQNPFWCRLLSVFAPVGRMALTNYLLQTVFYVLFFFHWSHGLKLYGKLTLTETYLLAVGLFSLQVLLSRWWLTRFQQGPVEAIWKSLSYRLAQRKQGAVQLAPQVTTVLSQTLHSK